MARIVLCFAAAAILATSASALASEYPSVAQDEFRALQTLDNATGIDDAAGTNATDASADAPANEVPVSSNETEASSNVTDSSNNNTDSTGEVVAGGTDGINTVVDGIAGRPGLSILEAALRASTFGDTLCRECNYTFFAPTDEAFDAFNPEVLGKILTPEWSFHLMELLSLHVTDPNSTGRLLSSDLTDGTTLTMLNGDNMTVEMLDGEATVRLVADFTNGSQVVEADAIFDNGVLHTVDNVFQPEFVVTDLLSYPYTPGGREFSMLIDTVYYLNIAPLIGDDDFTVFAPNDEAFMALGNETLASFRNPDNVANTSAALLNHVVSGVFPTSYFEEGLSLESEGGFQLLLSQADDGGWMVNDARILRTNILVNNGVVHSIDKVLLQPYTAPRPGSDAADDLPNSTDLNTTMDDDSNNTTTDPPSPAATTNGGSSGNETSKGWRRHCNHYCSPTMTMTLTVLVLLTAL